MTQPAMNAAVLHRARDMRLEQWPRPRMKNDGDLLVRIKSVGVCGSDVHYFQDGRIGDFVVTEPTVLGHESAGVVEQAAPGTGFKKGDRVALEPGVPCGTCIQCRRGDYHLCAGISFFGTFPAHGTYRDYVVHPAAYTYKLPRTMSFDEGAMIEPLSVGVHAVRNLVPVPDDTTVAVIGAGSIGLACLQMLRMGTARNIIVTDRIAPRLTLAKKLGADACVNITRKDPVKEIMNLTDGRGVDIVFEAAGQLDAHTQAEEIVRPGGTVVIIGIPAEDRFGFKAGTVRRKELRLAYVRRMRGTYPVAIDLVQRGLLDAKCLVTHHYTLKNIEKAFGLVEKYEDGVVKAIIKL